MTTPDTKSGITAVLSSALLDAFDAFAQSLVAYPHRMTPEMWPKGWLFFEAGWNAAILAEREACADAARDFLTKGRSPLGKAVHDAIMARSNAKLCGGTSATNAVLNGKT